jgi:predicted Zn-dependent peptidase
MDAPFAGFDQSLVRGVPVLHRRDSLGKTFRVAVLWRRPLDAQQAARALLPALLQHGTARHPDRPALLRARERLYGASTGFGVGRHGESSVLRLSADAVAGQFLPSRPDQFSALQELLAEQLLRPRLVTPGLPRSIFERERAQALASARSVVDDKGRLARSSAVLAACAGEPYGVEDHGGEAAIAATEPDGPAAMLADYVQHGSPFVLLAGVIPDDLHAALSPLLSALPPWTPFTAPPLVQPAPRAVRVVRDHAEMQQAKVVLVLRTPVPTLPAQLCVLHVALSLWGGGPHSRLFTEVREKRSLCYYASAGGDSDKGLVIVQSGCDAHAAPAVAEQSMAQLAEIAAGRFSDAELSTAIAVCQGPLRSVDDSPAARLSFTAEQYLRGFDEKPEQRIAALGRVRRDDVVAAAQSLWLDLDYALLPRTGS